MKKFLVGAAGTAATLAFATAALAVGPPYGGVYAAPSITVPDAGIGAQCQSAITKNTQKYVKSLLKTRGKCLLEGVYEACPNVEDDEKVQSAAIKASEGIASKCGDTSGLSSSYANATAANVASCTLSQTHGTVEIFLAETHGSGGVPDYGNGGVDNAARNECQAEIGKATQKLLPAVVKAVDKCISDRIKNELPTGIGAACLGSLNGATWTEPTDEKVLPALDKAFTKATDAVTDACGSLSTQQIKNLYSCPLATTSADLLTCVSMSALNATFEIVNQQYAETGTIVTEGTGNIQTAVSAGGVGDKFLIESGDYTEGVSLPAAACLLTAEACTDDSDCTVMVGNTCNSEGDDMQFVGCGAATDDRPVVRPPLMGAPLRGFFAAGVDGLHFQAIEVRGWENDGVFVTNADGVSFRDMVGDGDDSATAPEESVSTYAIFPVESNDVLIEGSEIYTVRDAGLYVGSATNIVVRHNLVHHNVTGIEIENSEFAQVYGNVATANTGGLLSFKLPGPAKQDSGDHHFFDNITYANNTPNFAIPGSTVAAVPLGTGFMILSEDDSLFENNIVELNANYGVLILDQEAVNLLVGDDVFDPKSADYFTERLTFLNNRVPTGARANSIGSVETANGNWTFALADGNNRDTCWTPAPVDAQAPLGNTFALCP